MTTASSCTVLLCLVSVLPLHVVAAPHALSTGHDRAAIYFPSSGMLPPQLDLNLRLDAMQLRIGGTGVLDMCLSDGAAAGGESLELTVRDAMGGAAAGHYGAWHTDGQRDAAGRLDYRISLRHAGVVLPLSPGSMARLQHTAPARWRTLQLPGMAAPVSCVMAQLQVTTDPFLATGKRAGRYHGAVQVELRLPASRP